MQRDRNASDVALAILSRPSGRSVELKVVLSCHLISCRLSLQGNAPQFQQAIDAMMMAIFDPNLEVTNSDTNLASQH